jgi:hypothetical protein
MYFKKRFNTDFRKSDTATLSECIEEMLRVYKLKGKYNQVNLIASWEKIMGKTIANRTENVFFKGTTLMVKLNSAPLKHQLSMSKSKVIELINKEYPQPIVDDIAFL